MSTSTDYEDEGQDCDGATVELVRLEASRRIEQAPAMPLATGPARTLPDYTSYPHQYGMVWMHQDHVGIEFQVSKCEGGAQPGPRPPAAYMADAWLAAHPGGSRTGRWPQRYVIRYDF